MRSKLAKSSSSRSNGFFANSGKRSSNGIQAKLQVNKPGDKYEVEADKTADHVVGQSMGSILSSKSSAPGADFGKPLPVTLRPSVSSSAQRKEEDVQAKESENQSESEDVQLKESEIAPMGMSDKDLGEEDPIRAQAIQMKEDESVQLQEEDEESEDTPLNSPEIQAKEEEVQAKEDEDVQLQKDEEVQLQDDEVQAKEDEEVQAKEFVGSSQSTNGVSIDQKLSDSKGGGSPLPKGVKAEMESGFGVDFSAVRIHTDSRAESMNEEVGAKAFTHKNDIYFNQGNFDTESKEGKLLLAHELTHTIQQRAAIQNDSLFLKREPNKEDKIQLTKFQVYLSVLQAKRDDLLNEIQERVNTQIPDLEANIADETLSPEHRKMLEKYKMDRYLTWEKWIKEIDDAISFVEYEEFTYRWTLENSAGKYDKIVWHSSGLLSGWIRESESAALREMESSMFYRMGVRHGTFFSKLRAEGASFEEAVLKTVGLGFLDITGVSSIVEGVSGYEISTGRKLSTEERVVKGVVGLISVASIVSIGGPRIAQWAKNVPSGNLKVFQMAPSGGFSGVMLAAEGNMVIALTHAEIVTLVGAGLLNTSVLHMSTGQIGGKTPTKIDGLNGANRGVPRGGGGKRTDREYAKKVNEKNGSKPTDESVYVKDVEFDGFNPKTKYLLDAKRSKGKGSWYDISGKDSFTLNVKIPNIIKQAQRQVKVLKESGASGIEWHISDAGIAKQIRDLLKTSNLSIIKVKHTPF